MTIGPQKDEKDDKGPKRWQTLEKMTTDNSAACPEADFLHEEVHYLLRELSLIVIRMLLLL